MCKRSTEQCSQKWTIVSKLILIFSTGGGGAIEGGQ